MPDQDQGTCDLRLIDLMNGENIEVSYGANIAETDIVGLTSDSRQVQPGFLFAAIPGTAADGARFIPDAISRGAVAVLAPPGIDAGVSIVHDSNPRRRYALMAARFYGRQPSSIAAITGTNGKTSVASFVRQIWTRLGHQAASIGTLGIVAPQMQINDGLTTPDPADLHANLAALADQGVDTLAMEASSHGLDQCRLDGVDVSLAGFTNLSHDHLDYHKTMDAYLQVKTRLFSDILKSDGTAVLNADDAAYATLAEIVEGRGCRLVSYGRQGEDIRLMSAEPGTEGQRLKLRVLGETHDILLPLAGSFQVENALCALGLVIAGGALPADALKALQALEGVPGRLQKISETATGGSVYVDYAHTPDALANVLSALRPHATGALRVVFGCGGDRDRTKRAEMARIACDLADSVIVTDDNPRSEDAASIRAEILAACSSALEIGDRAEAINTAVRGLDSGDVLVVAGKGHETGQIVGENVFPFDDGDEIRRAVQGGA